MSELLPVYTDKLVYTKKLGVIKIEQEGRYKIGVTSLFIKLFNRFINEY